MKTRTPPNKITMPSRIKNVSIAGFRSLAMIEHLELPQLAVLIGANGAGKSNFIQFFDMLSWMLRGQNLQEFILRQGGGDDQLFMGARQTPRMNAELRIQTQHGFNDYRFTLVHLSAGDTLMLADEAFRFAKFDQKQQTSWTQFASVGKEAQLVAAADPAARLVVDLFKHCAIYQFHNTSAHAYIRQPWDAEDNVWLRSDGANLASILLRLQEHDIHRYKMIVRQITRVLPTFGNFALQSVFGKVALRWRGKYADKTFGSHLTSDGSLRLFCLLTLLNLSPLALPDVLFFDEPELGLHPHAITLVAAMLKKLAQTRQVVIATQSPYMVNCFDLENIIVATTQDGTTSLHDMPRAQYQEWLDDDYLLSDLWLKNVVGGAQ